MSVLDGITGADARWRSNGSSAPSLPAAAGAPGRPNASQALRQRFDGVFHETFNQNMATVFERGAAGAFDDPTIALAEQAALQRLRAATQSGMRGADAAPGSAPTPDRSAQLAARRELNEVRIEQSEARLHNVSNSLEAEFPKAAQLPSASTGSWDPATFVPRSAEEAEAFAQRMVIDATEGAARLEIVQTQLDAAKFEAANGSGSPAEVAKLQAAYDRQRAYVDKLAAIVDGQTGGMVSDAGDDALAGDTMRDANDLPVEEIARSLRASGMSERQVERVVGATELSVEEEQTPGGSPRLKAIASSMTRFLLTKFQLDREEYRREDRRLDEKRAIARRTADRRAAARAAERERLEERFEVVRREQRARMREAVAKAAARRQRP